MFRKSKLFLKGVANEKISNCVNYSDNRFAKFRSEKTDASGGYYYSTSKK
jgi:hypothetical protein